MGPFSSIAVGPEPGKAQAQMSHLELAKTLDSILVSVEGEVVVHQKGTQEGVLFHRPKRHSPLYLTYWGAPYPRNVPASKSPCWVLSSQLVSNSASSPFLSIPEIA